MKKIAIGDWFLSRSEAFKILVEKFKEHLNDYKIELRQQSTKSGFSRVKARHYFYDRRFNELNARVKELENILETLNENPIKIEKKKK